jgi:hypothetical protein
MHRNFVTCFSKIELCFQCCLTSEMSPLVCVSCFEIVWVARVLLSFCDRLRGDGGCWVKTHWNWRAFRSDNVTSNLLLDGNIGKRRPNCNIVHAVHLSKWRVVCNQRNSELNCDSKTIQRTVIAVLMYVYIDIYKYISHSCDNMEVNSER